MIEPLHLVMLPWPFHKWDYFTKWIEVESITTISVERVRLYWKRLICCFGLSTVIVSDNETQFASRYLFTLVEHSQTNSQAESPNKVILRGLRRRLEEEKGRWIEELPQVLWSYHITPHSTTHETHFRLTFDTKAMILVEIKEPYPRTALFHMPRIKKKYGSMRPKHAQQDDMIRRSPPDSLKVKT
ncbi:hypothetical protein CR513_06089, partial [Mucuna pruriens]